MVSRDSVVDGYRYHKYVIEIAKTFGGCAYGAQRTAAGKDFELILTVKMGTRHPVGGLLAVSFRLLYSLRSYDGLKSQDLENFWGIFAFFWKNDLLW